MARSAPRLTTVLLGVGVLLVAVVAVDLAARGLRQHPEPPVWSIPGGDAERGRTAIEFYGCGACHAIPGIRSARGRVGPQLAGFSEQMYVAGRLPNTPPNLVFWIRHPQRVDPQTAMPDLGVSEEEARDIAAYLYTLR